MLHWLYPCFPLDGWSDDAFLGVLSPCKWLLNRLQPHSSFFFRIQLLIRNYIKGYHSLTHGAEPFLRSCQFMEPEGLLPCSQEPSIGPIQSIPYYPISLRSISILSTHLSLGLPSSLIPSGFSTNILYVFLFSPIRATCPAHVKGVR
jgi:hypothetical protein